MISSWADLIAQLVLTFISERSKSVIYFSGHLDPYLPCGSPDKPADGTQTEMVSTVREKKIYVLLFRGLFP